VASFYPITFRFNNLQPAVCRITLEDASSSFSLYDGSGLSIASEASDPAFVLLPQELRFTPAINMAGGNFDLRLFAVLEHPVLRGLVELPNGSEVTIESACDQTSVIESNPFTLNCA
jgi:hypothetical protein